jgi:hypothetical protein
MKRYVQNTLLLSGSLLIHAAAFWLLAPAVSEIGKNIPVLTYPIRVRVIEGSAAAANGAVAQAAAAPRPLVEPFVEPSVAPAARKSPEEGRIDASETHFQDFSTRYFTANELDDRPAMIAAPDLDAIPVGPLTEGNAILRIFINEAGAVDRMEVEQSTLPDLMLEQLLAQRDQLRFTSGNKNGLNVKSVILYQIKLAREASVMPAGRPAEPGP